MKQANYLRDLMIGVLFVLAIAVAHAIPDLLCEAILSPRRTVKENLASIGVSVESPSVPGN